MSVDPEVLQQLDDDFDRTRDFRYLKMKLEYIEEEGTSEDIDSYYNRAVQEASLAFLSQIASGIGKNENVEFEIPGVDGGVLVLRNSGTTIYIAVEGLDDTGNRFDRHFTVRLEEPRGPFKMKRVRESIDRMESEQQRQMNEITNPTMGGGPEFYRRRADITSRALDALKLPLFDEIKPPETEQPQPPEPETPESPDVP